jgi:hypothetical protein
MSESSWPDRSRTLIVYGGMVIPVTDNGDHRTVGLMTHAAESDLDQAVVLMTPDEARHIAAELVAYANR